MFSPLIYNLSSLAIIYVDLWVPGKCSDSKCNVASINDMCEITQFVVVILVINEVSTTLT